ncbi:hypothetical protein GCM10011320_31580 [Neoroseomonas lacus]|uniref:Uncharacterized protein n=2 Tax=Neoroseomonas lacus TaxID=287609 RepID=A0A917NRT8_9PROT|nr:hypothetical protein GCM10011320_31580 [Neoroseomonas lacus]
MSNHLTRRDAISKHGEQLAEYCRMHRPSYAAIARFIGRAEKTCGLVAPLGSIVTGLLSSLPAAALLGIDVAILTPIAGTLAALAGLATFTGAFAKKRDAATAALEKIDQVDRELQAIRAMLPSQPDRKLLEIERRVVAIGLDLPPPPDAIILAASRDNGPPLALPAPPPPALLGQPTP